MSNKVSKVHSGISVVSIKMTRHIITRTEDWLPSVDKSP